MRRYLSIFMLLARSSMRPFVGILGGMALVEFGLFYVAMIRNRPLEDTLVRSHIPWAFALGFLLLSVVLARVGCERGAKTGYTLRRLQITEVSFFYCQASFNALCYGIFLAAQIAISCGLMQYYIATADASYVSGQSVFLACYRNPFLHSLLPLDEMSRMVRNVIFMLGLGFASAQYPVRQRAGQWGIELIVLVCVGIPMFAGGVGNIAGDILLGTVTVAIVWVILGNCPERKVS